MDVLVLTYDDEAQGLSMLDEPKSDKQSHSEEDGENSQPIPLSPPQGKQEANTENKAGDFASDDVETTEDEQCADERRPKVTSRQRDGALAAHHVRHTTFTGVK